MRRAVVAGMLAAAGVLVPAGRLGADQTPFCQFTHTKHLDAYYGTGKVVDANGSVVNSVDGLELTGYVSQNLADQIQATHGDTRVTGRIQSWVNTTDDMAWVLDPPEGLDAENNLAAALNPANLTSDPIAGTSDTGPVFRGTDWYYLTAWLG